MKEEKKSKMKFLTVLYGRTVSPDEFYEVEEIYQKFVEDGRKAEKYERENADEILETEKNFTSK